MLHEFASDVLVMIDISQCMYEPSNRYLHNEGRKNDDGSDQSLRIQKRATLLQKQMERSLSEEALFLMTEEHEQVLAYLMDRKEHDASSSEMVHGLVPEETLTQKWRKDSALKGGTTMNITRVLQKI